MANMIYTVAVNHDTSQFKNSDYSQYCIKSWRRWCHKNDIEFMILTEHDDRYKYPVWNKDLIFEILKATDTEYDKIGYVDSDTMVHWDAPNPFDMYDDEFCWVKDCANFRWTSKSIETYNKFYPNQTLDIYDYYNSGVSFFTKEHKFIYDNLQKLYKENSEALDECATKGVGKVQTLLNFELQKQNIKIKELPPIWNMFSMHKRDLLYQTLDGIPIEPFGFAHNWQDGDDKTPFFIKYCWIWHFTGFPIEERTKMMKQTWELVGDKYKWNQ